MNQIQALFSAFQLHERVRLRQERDKERGRERQRKRKRKNRGAERRREAIPNMNIFPSFTAKGPIALQPLESTGYAQLWCRHMLWSVRIVYARGLFWDSDNLASNIHIGSRVLGCPWHCSPTDTQASWMLHPSRQVKSDRCYLFTPLVKIRRTCRTS